MLLEPDTLRNERFIDLPPDSVIFGTSATMLDLQEKLQRTSGTNLPILLQGESGVGKGLLSKFIHNQSNRIVGPYVRVNCASPLDTSLESEPFISLEGAHEVTDSIVPESPESSSIGTLYLDEVAELPSELQLKLLDFLYNTPPRGGDNQGDRRTKARIICATTRNLRQEVNEGRFRRELFYRLAVITLEVPPLRHRLYDLLIIANYLRMHYSGKFGLPDKPFPDRLVERMHYYEWPGNIRELDSFVCRYVILGSEERMLRDLSSHNDSTAVYDMISPGNALLKQVTRRTLAELEREMIVKALDLHNGNLKKAAQSLGISYRTLMNKMDQAGLPRTRHSTKSGGDAPS